MSKNIEKVLLINPSNTIERESIRRTVTPLGLLYVAATLEQNGFDVSVIDSPCEGYENLMFHDDYVTYGLSDQQLEKRIKEKNPDAVGVTCCFSYQEKKIYNISNLVKSIDKNIITFTGGIHPSLFAEKMMNDCKAIDFAILKEGEYRTTNLFKAINSNKNYEKQEGIAFRKNNKIKVNPATSYIKNLDDIPSPARHLIDMEKKFKINKPFNPFLRNEKAEVMVTSRGCPFNCCFCAGSSYWGNIRMRGVDNIIGEMRLLKDEYGVKEIQFADDNMTVNKKRMMELTKRMKEFNFDWCTPGGVLMSTLDEEMIKAMAESGCYQLTFSPETGSQRVLTEIIHKPLNLKIVKNLVKICHKYGINIHSNFILGLPGETKNELISSFDFAKDVEFDSAAFFIAVPYAGTELYETCMKRGWLKSDMSKADFKHANIQIGEHEKEYVMSGKEMEKLVDEKTKEFNEWSKKRNAEAWNKKFEVFLKNNQQGSDDIIMGRVV